MTKARARQRAKAKAGQKTKKHAAEADRPGKFDPGSGSIKRPAAAASTRNFAESRSGSARGR